MGFSTFTVGLLPTFEQVGWLAPILLLTLRLMQGLALGGEYGGAATYVAEYNPATRRGYATSWIQTTATSGLLLALIVIGVCRWQMPSADFELLGWRIPFLFSIFLLAFSVYIRISLRETPVFLHMKAEGRSSEIPVWESFFKWPNNKFIVLSLLGATAGQGVVWYTAQFYTLFFLTITLHLDYLTTYLLVGVALAIGTPFFIFFGWLSDKIGRLKIILAGCLMAAATYFPAVSCLILCCQPGAGRVPGGEPDHAARGRRDLQRPHLRWPLVELQPLRSSHRLPDEVGSVLHQGECTWLQLCFRLHRWPEGGHFEQGQRHHQRHARARSVCRRLSGIDLEIR